MRVYGPAGSRSYPEDRNPLRINVGATSFTNVAGGGQSIFATYTVPAGRKFKMYGCSAFLKVTTVLAAGQTAFVRLIVNSGTTPHTAYRETAAAAALGTTASFENVQGYGQAGDIFTLDCTVSAGTGAVSTAGGLNGVEYDA